MTDKERQTLRDFVAMQSPDQFGRLADVVASIDVKLVELEGAKRSEYGEGIQTGLNMARTVLFEALG